LERLRLPLASEADSLFEVASDAAPGQDGTELEGVSAALLVVVVVVVVAAAAAVVVVVAMANSVSLPGVSSDEAPLSSKRFSKSFLRPSVGNPCFFKAALSSVTFMSVGLVIGTFSVYQPW
jgi:hypothetical protein